MQSSRRNSSSIAGVGDSISHLKELSKLTKAKRAELTRKYDLANTANNNSGTNVEPVKNAEKSPLRRYTISSKTKEILKKNQRNY